MIDESQLCVNSTEAKLLYDIRLESRKTNEKLSQLLEALYSIAKNTEPKIVKPVKGKVTKSDKPKRGNKDAKIK